MRLFIKILLTFGVSIGTISCQQGSFVVTSTQPPLNPGSVPEHADINQTGSLQQDQHQKPNIYAMDIFSNVTNRFATTLITSKVRNVLKTPEECVFSVVLPENAFVAEFTMEIDGQVYQAYVKEKEEAKQIYKNAIGSGVGAAKVEASPRDSNTFTVTVHTEPESKAIFRLTYEELLQRELGQYEVVLNINPGQIVDDLGVTVEISESRPLVFVKTLPLRTGNEIGKTDPELNPKADVEILNKTSCKVSFHPSKSDQEKFAALLTENGEPSSKGLKGQFVVQYDVERDDQGGEILVQDGYFVHFFAPTNLKPLSKHVVFVMDDSASMSGRKIEQLVDAMQNILPELNPGDVFDMVRFGERATIWDVRDNSFKDVFIENPQYGHLESTLEEYDLPPEATATPANISIARDLLGRTAEAPGWSTNIMAGLEVALYLLKRTHERLTGKFYQPMVVFLTDGEANEGVSEPDVIVDAISGINSRNSQAAMFCLSFGDYANKEFLRKLCLSNSGFSRHIYEAADASLQLQDFYKRISSPLLANVSFKYVDGTADVTKDYYPFLLEGSEIVVSGKNFSQQDVGNLSSAPIQAINCLGDFIQLYPIVERPVSSLERLWAYLTVKQLLEKTKIDKNPEPLRKTALDLALKYSFVTDVSSLVVVKPNATATPVNPQSRSSDVDGDKINSPESFAGPQATRLVESEVQEEPVTVTPHDQNKGSSPYNKLQKKKKKKSPKTPAPVSDLEDSKIIRVKPLTIKEKIQKHIDVLTNGTNKLTTPQGEFDFGKSGDVTVHPECPKTPNNGTAGHCTLLIDCPRYFTIVKSLAIVQKYFCPLEGKFVGVCCPKRGKKNRPKQ